MNPSDIKRQLEVAFPDCEIAVQGGDGKFLVTATGAAFQGLSAVKRQQAVYAVLHEHIGSGAIHAVTMDLKTAVERNA